MTPLWMAGLIIGTAIVIAGIAWDLGRLADRDEHERLHGRRLSRAERRQLADIEHHLATAPDVTASGDLFAIPRPKDDPT